MITQEQILGQVPFSLSGTIPSDEGTDGTVVLQRQALHAQRLAFVHPATEQLLEVTAPLPPDMQSVLDCLEQKTR
jgi:hypothetical protein